MKVTVEQLSGTSVFDYCIVGSGPAGITANPTYTIVQLALRLAEHLARQGNA